MKPGVIKVITNSKACQGCRSCEAICSLKHFGVVNPNASGIKISELEELGKFKQIVCQQCMDMPCAAACSQNAIVRDTFSGAVTINNDCMGCGVCVNACRVNAIWIVELEGKKKAVKCDLCGGVPQCVSICPRQALGW